MADAASPSVEPSPEPEMTEREQITAEQAEIPVEVGPGWGRMKCDYQNPSFEKALPAKKGDVVYVISTENSEWYGVKNSLGQTGFIPASMLELESAEPPRGPMEGGQYHPLMRRQMRRFLELAAPVRVHIPRMANITAHGESYHKN
eukprot:SAG31_NODE_2866_length_4979_cov_3.027869_2_plen_146_part_00